MSTQQAILKGILLDIVNELQNLRANQVVLSRLVGDGTKLMTAVDAKTEALKEVEPLYSEMRRQIGELVP